MGEVDARELGVRWELGLATETYPYSFKYYMLARGYDAKLGVDLVVVNPLTRRATAQESSMPWDCRASLRRRFH